MESQINPPMFLLPPLPTIWPNNIQAISEVAYGILPLLSVSLFLLLQSFQFLVDKKTLEKVFPLLPLTWWELECD